MRSKPCPHSLQMYSKIGINPRALVTRRSFFDPIRNEDVRFAFGLGIAIRSPDQFFPVIREHRESIERFVEGDLFQTRAVAIDQKFGSRRLSLTSTKLRNFGFLELAEGPLPATVTKV